MILGEVLKETRPTPMTGRGTGALLSRTAHTHSVVVALRRGVKRGAKRRFHYLHESANYLQSNGETVKRDPI